MIYLEEVLYNQAIISRLIKGMKAETKTMEKRFKNESGEILVRHAIGAGRCGIVEMIHLYDKNESGCVIGAWKVQEGEGEPFAEFRSINDRIMNTKYDDPGILLSALKFGQKLADLLIETGNYEKS
jgi:hypothetical protein